MEGVEIGRHSPRASKISQPPTHMLQVSGFKHQRTACSWRQIQALYAQSLRTVTWYVSPLAFSLQFPLTHSLCSSYATFSAKTSPMNYLYQNLSLTRLCASLEIPRPLEHIQIVKPFLPVSSSSSSCVGVERRKGKISHKIVHLPAVHQVGHRVVRAVGIVRRGCAMQSRFLKITFTPYLPTCTVRTYSLSSGH